MRKPTKSVVALRPPQRLLEAVDSAAFDSRLTRSAVIRDALSKFTPEPRNPDAPCPVRSLYVRLNSRLADVPVGFSARPHEMRAYRAAAKQAGVPFNGLVSLAIAKHVGA